MAKKSFWKLPAALAISMALVLASCGGNDGPSIPTTNAGLGTSEAARTLSGYVYLVDMNDYSFTRINPGAQITDITSDDYLPGETGTISAEGYFTFVLPLPLPAGTTLEPFTQFFDVEDIPGASISNADAMAFAVSSFDSPGIWTPPAAPLYEGWLFRGNVGANFEESVEFIFVDRDVTLTLSQEFSSEGLTTNPFTINFAAGWNVVHFRFVPVHNGYATTVRGGEPAGLKWILD